MKTIILANNVELKAETLIGIGDTLSITFSEEEGITKLMSIYSPKGEQYSENALREFTIKNDKGEVDGVHQGYTKFISITSDGLKCTVKVERENELLTRIEKQDETIAKLLLLVAGGEK